MRTSIIRYSKIVTTLKSLQNIVPANLSTAQVANARISKVSLQSLYSLVLRRGLVVLDKMFSQLLRFGPTPVFCKMKYPQFPGSRNDES